MARKGGKYAGLLDHLPKYPTIEPERKDVVEEVQKKILDATKAPDDPTKAPDDPPVAELLDSMDLFVNDIIDIALHATGGKRNATTFAKVYAEVRGVRKKLEEWDKSIGLLIEAYESLMLDAMDNEGMTSMKLANGQPISTWEEPYFTVSDREAFRQWCIKDGLERQLSLHPSTMASLSKARLAAGEPEPDGVTAWSYKKIRLGSEE